METRTEQAWRETSGDLHSWKVRASSTADTKEKRRAESATRRNQGQSSFEIKQKRGQAEESFAVISLKAKQSSSRERESQKQAPFPGIYSHLPHWNHLLQEATLIPLKSPSPERHIPHLRTTSALQHSGKNHQTPWGTCFFCPPEGLPAPRLSPETPPLAVIPL